MLFEIQAHAKKKKDIDVCVVHVLSKTFISYNIPYINLEIFIVKIFFVVNGNYEN